MHRHSKEETLLFNRRIKQPIQILEIYWSVYWGNWDSKDSSHNNLNNRPNLLRLPIKINKLSQQPSDRYWRTQTDLPFSDNLLPE